MGRGKFKKAGRGYQRTPFYNQARPNKERNEPYADKKVVKPDMNIGKEVALPVSTRGIGFATCGLMHRINPYPEINPPSIYSIYRAGLGILEAKICYHRNNIPNPPGTRPVHPLESQFFPPTLTEGDFTLPEPLFSCIISVGIVRASGTKYGPVLMPDNYLKEEGAPIIVPNPCNVLLTNLRETVMALADPRLPQTERDEFIAHNPIPGCRFIGGVLDNPDDIIQNNYGYNEFNKDIQDLQTLCWHMSGVVPHYKPACIKLSAKGTRAILLSNSMDTLRCRDMPEGCSDEDYRKNCEPEGDVIGFWSREYVNNKYVREGIVALLGELPTNLQELHPLHQRRLQERVHTYDLNYKDLLLTNMERWSF